MKPHFRDYLIGILAALLALALWNLYWSEAKAHVLEAPNVLLADLEASSQIRPTWALPDGRVWLREVR